MQNNNLQTAFSLFLEEYSKAQKEGFAKHPLKEFMSEEIIPLIEQVIADNQRYKIEGSVGKGNWARVPWIAIFDTLVTTSAQRGYYIVYLACEDLSGFYLSLNQGVKTIKDNYGIAAKDALRIKSKDYAAKLGALNKSSLIKGCIDLKATSRRNISADYEAGAIYSIFYPASNIPPDETLKKDLLYFLELYFSLSAKSLDDNFSFDKSRSTQYEDLRYFREHKRVERNQKLSKDAKKIHGSKCKICDFDFFKVYGEIGKDYIEAHHLTPLSKLKGQKIALDPRKDFTVLCANCHRMIHRTNYVEDINKFKEQHFKFGKGC